MTYKPYVCLWMIRFFSIIISYAYHGYPAFVILTWVLLSFMTPNYPFVNCTSYLYLPIFTCGFIFTYFININGIFLTYESGSKQFIYAPIFSDFGRSFNYPPIEVAGMVLNIIFLIQLVGSKNELKVNRDEFRRAIFEKLTDR